jgi:hypothetical protein
MAHRFCRYKGQDADDNLKAILTALEWEVNIKITAQSEGKINMPSLFPGLATAAPFKAFPQRASLPASFSVLSQVLVPASKWNSPVAETEFAGKRPDILRSWKLLQELCRAALDLNPASTKE